MSEPTACAKCRQPFDRQPRYTGSPFCRQCVDRCFGTEIADHWCPVDKYFAGDPD
ncbi:hypothetical protein [Streptomyces noursei]|uniref:hypothetical protein n=1 Tax=Streptomyces noursei TaxID=1971 RepID=UPI00045F0A1F|nr:hypothetical protein [Streptomyces noursei]AIA08606.1 hypothetical protein DC74_p00022 [Streptomyces noursei]